MKIKVTLRKNSQKIYSSEKNYNRWSEVSQVVIGQEIYNFDSEASSPREIVFTSYSEGVSISLDCLEDLNEIA